MSRATTAQTPKLRAPETELERYRFEQLTLYEREAPAHPVAGVDEAGRGPLAGPVVAAACVLPQGHFHPDLDDSKKITERRREGLFEVLTNDPEVAYGVGIVSPEEIDRVNIYQATILAMLQAVDALPREPNYLLVDGLKLPHPHIGVRELIKGDTLSLSIMAASVIAKVTRDRMMREYDRQWPEYGFAKHKGYGTQAHRQAIMSQGPCQIHRKTFEPIKSLIALS